MTEQVFGALYNTDDNCLVAAPTGSGKTACAEFAVLRMIQKAAQDKGVARCIYIAPLPALARERLADWTAKVCLSHPRDEVFPALDLCRKCAWEPFCYLL